MWNFNNGAKMHEFQSRKKEVTSLLYLPRTLQCVVGIGWERIVVRWPDASAPKNTEPIIHDKDHRAEVTSVAYFGSILVTGGSDGEIIVWHMDSARVNKRMDIPKTPRTGKRPGVAKMLFIDFPNGLLLLLAGTDDGSMHFIKVSSSETIFSLFEVYSDPIIGMAANRIGDDDSTGFSGARTRLIVADCQVEAKLWDISGIVSEHITDVPLLKSWEPHPGGTTTDVIAVDDIQSFLLSSDTGEISVWTTEGDLRAKFAQRKAWPIADPRTSSLRLSADGAPTTERREAGSDDSSDESDVESGPMSGASTRRGSVLESPQRSSRRHKKASTPPKKEVSFAESHPMYVPQKDECQKYLQQEYSQQAAMEATQAAKDRLAERERREAERKPHLKLGLHDMLNKLEVDLRHQHERQHQQQHGGMSLDSSSAVGGGHVYEKFSHHSTGSSQPSNHLHFSSTHDPLGDHHERPTPRPPRMRHIAHDDDSHPAPATAMAGSSSSGHHLHFPMSSRSSTGRHTGSQSHRDRARVSFVGPSRTISNHDVFAMPASARLKKEHAHRK
jgi:hypothetical protein